MALSDLTRDAVLQAIAEFDQLGREAFLDHYGFSHARDYFVVHEGRQYDSKAIAGVAHRFIAPGGRALPPADFSGGEVTVEKTLRALGFEFEHAGRNPDWTRDELILALDLYMRNPRSPPGKSSKEVSALSETLNRLGERLGLLVNGKYRNINGVYMKLMNFRRFDPEAVASGRSGLRRGNSDEEAVWQEFASDLARLKATADAITSALANSADWSIELPPIDDAFTEAPEGRLLTRIHLVRERNRKLVERKKAAALVRMGRLFCEVCDFDFEARYGDRGRGFIEAHHTKPVHTLGEGAMTNIGDLALVCANCHRMIHAVRPWLTLIELRSLLRTT